MPISAIDHLVVTAANLAVGIDYVEQTLECKMQSGGQHPRMGTHNALLKLGDQSYLEVIAIDPNAAHPQRPRWFELDTLAANKRLDWPDG
ncbi:MAG: VOC family protein [Planctomycetaceae bacterium]